MSGPTPRITNEARSANALESINQHLEVIAAVMLQEHEDAGGNVSEVSLYRQLAGNSAGFADELDSILEETDAFKRAQRLRKLQGQARSIADTYVEKAEEAESFEIPDEDDEDDEPENSSSKE